MRYLILLVLIGACGAPASENPFQAHALRSSERRWIAGEVVERLPAGPYTYLLLRVPGGHTEWLAALRGLTPGDSRVRALVLGRAEHFHSKRLGRDFSPLSFAAVRSAADLSPDLTLAKEIRP
jgi:hypothetical protein